MFASVASLSHLDRALVAVRSALDHHPAYTGAIFVIDAPQKALDTIRSKHENLLDKIVLFGPEGLESGGVPFQDLFGVYNTMELACLGKYVGVRECVRRFPDLKKLIFLDSDTLVLSDLDLVFSIPGSWSVALTPHLSKPASVSIENDIMRHGWANAGVIAFQPDSPLFCAILEWLIDRISARGFFAPELGLSCDQTWVEALPFLFPPGVTLVGGGGINVGYWNLHEYTWPPDEECPIRVFHFSGFDWDNYRLSRHSTLDQAAVPGLQAIIDHYVEAHTTFRSLRLTAAQCARHVPAEGPLHRRLQRSPSPPSLDAVPGGPFARLGHLVDSTLRRFIP